ncbi:MAG: succinyl-diaminopimelate desuccinylase [Rhodospirillales bacterium]|nr:succinyl-diaminopimelate desuccinylase [Rhodospirillales bacterium]
MTDNTPTDPIPIAQALIRCRSVTPIEGGALTVLEDLLRPLGFTCTRLRFGPPDAPVENLFARLGTGAPHFCYAGHTDVVPPGERGWTDDPFSGEIRDGLLYGRGACDMKGGIAAFMAGLTDFLRSNPKPRGSISLLITGDEEGPSIDGTKKVLEWMQDNGQVPDMALVGEPTSQVTLGDTLKIGRRGSMTARITVHGIQGHSAYPQKADNPIHRMIRVLGRLTAGPLDAGSDWFEPSTLQVTGFDVGNTASNVIPAEARAMLSIRFNDLHTSADVRARIAAALDAEAARADLAISVAGESFLTQNDSYIEGLQRAIRRTTGRDAKLDTGGGTSDARFIASYCPVAELGAVGATMHQVNEHAPVAELRDLASLYRTVLEELLP